MAIEKKIRKYSCKCWQNNKLPVTRSIKSSKSLGKKLGEILVDSKIITEDEIIEAIEQQTGIKRLI